MTPTGGSTISKHTSGLVRAALFVACPLAAQDTSPRARLYDRLQVSGSLTTIILNTNIRVDPANGTGTDIDAEDDLGLDRSKFEPRFAVRWRPGRRHEIEVGYQFARRSSTRVLDRDITFGDSTYQLGATVNSNLNTDEASLIYRFAFHTRPRREIGFSLGLGALFLDAGLDAVGSGGSVQFSQSQKLTGPIGSAGLYGRFLSGERWYWGAEAR